MAPFDQAQSAWLRMSRLMKGLTLMCATATAVYAAIIGFGPAWLALGLPALATQHHVATEVGKVDKRIEQIAETTIKADARMIEGQIETVEVRRTLVDKEIFELDMMIRNTPSLAEPVRSTLELRKRALDQDQRNLDHRLDALQRARASRRP